ncbi:MAG: glycosyltransferase [Planctomycetota bacterium]
MGSHDSPPTPAPDDAPNPGPSPERSPTPAPSAAPIRRITAVSPAFDRPDDLQSLARALAELDRTVDGRAIELSVLVVDNASSVPVDASSLGFGSDTRVIRLDDNLGGSGGFNAGLRAALRSACDAVWLLDSDAVPRRDALTELIRALDARPNAAAAGSALADEQGVYEIGGDVRPADGEYLQHAPAHNDHGDPREVGYHAACSLLVRRSAIESAGLMPDLFLCGDDVAWCHHLRRAAGPVLAVPASVVEHPHPARMRTTVRAYQARNGLTNAVRFGLSPVARARRVLRDAARAACQVVVGRDDLADLHLAGLRAAFRSPEGPLELPPVRPWRPLDELPPDERSTPSPTLKRSSIRSLVTWLVSPRRDRAVVNARAMPAAWVPAKTVVTVSNDGWTESRPTRLGVLRRLTVLGARSLVLAGRAAVSPPTVPLPEPVRRDEVASLSVVLLTQPARLERLKRTLSRLMPALAERRVRAVPTEVVVVCNGGTIDAADLPDPGVRLRVVDIAENTGVDGFNHGVRAAAGDAVLILDDDAWPDPVSLGRAVSKLRTGSADAVAFHRCHPRSGSFEWPGNTDRRDARPAHRDAWPSVAWPDMGCCNLVRRDAWWAAGGYESGYFLYRNDTDLALTLAALGRTVLFDPTIVAWHDSPSVGRPSPAWFRLATRNWVWLCRRHGRGVWAVLGVVLGWAWSHTRARLRPSCHIATLAGLWSGLTAAPPAVRTVPSDGSALRRLVSLKVRLGRTGSWLSRRRPTPEAPPAPSRSAAAPE